MYVMRIPLSIAAFGWPFIVCLVVVTMAASASIASATGVVPAVLALYVAPIGVFSLTLWLLFIAVHAASPPPGTPRLSSAFILHSFFVTIRLACIALYFILNVMHYVPLVLVTWSIADLPAPANCTTIFSVLPITVFLTPIILFFFNNAGLFLLGLYTIKPHQLQLAAEARSQLSTLLTHELPFLASVSRAGRRRFAATSPIASFSF
jgi:hypothetical protein